MKAITNTAPRGLEWLDQPIPVPGAGQVRIRTGACGICATDLEMIDGWARTAFPSVPGHEWSGTVDAVGDRANSGLVGKRCVAENVWADGGEVGFEHPGGYAQYLITEAANVQVLPDDFALTTAALIEPLAVCVRATRRLGAVSGTVLVFGDGPIGLLTTALLQRSGVADIVLVGGRDQRLSVARDFGARVTLNYHSLKGDLADEIRAVSQQSFGAVIEATGSAKAIRAGMSLLGQEGKLLIIGDYAQQHADFLWNTILIHEITLLGSNASAGAWPEAVRLAVHGEVNLSRLITHKLPAERYVAGMAITRSRAGDVIKVILDWEH
jgi:2-desacetyl-2-hydroxyethyl bacteriochlorophyllide A dehydrogenase